MKNLAKEEIHRYSERGHAGSWSQSGSYREQVEMENSDSQWQPLKRDKPKGKEEELLFYSLSANFISIN